MGKVLKTVGVVVAGVALAATGIGAIAMPGIVGATTLFGVSTSTLLLAGTAASALGSALSAKKVPVSTSSIDRLNVSITLDAPRKAVVGHTAFGTDLRYQEWWGADQEYCSQVLLCASHWCESIDQIWLDDELAWTLAGGVQGKFQGYLAVGQAPQAHAGSVYTNDWSNRWGANAVFTGCSTLYLQFKVTGNGKKAESPFSSSITSRVTVVGKGARVYDPRLDDTAGGAGPHRAGDQSTWKYFNGTQEIGRNPALGLLFYLLGWRINGKVAVGCGIPARRLDLDSFITAANLCDEQVLRADGSYEPRYRADGMMSEGDDPTTTIAAFEAAMNGKLRDTGGKLSLQVYHNDLSTPLLDFTDDDVLGEFTWSAGNPLNTSRKNIVKGRFSDPSSTALFQLSDYPTISLASLDGIDRIDTFDLALVQNPNQAQRLAKQRLQRAQYAGTFEASFNAKGWAAKDGDIVRLTFPALGFVLKPFRVDLSTVDVTGVTPMRLIEENAAIYQWDAEEAPAVHAADPISFDAVNAAVVQAIRDVEETADEIKAQVAAIASDGYISAGQEKRDFVRIITDIQNEKPILDARAQELGVGTSVYDDAYSALMTLINSFSPAWNDLGQSTAVNPTILNGRLNDYEYAKINLVTANAQAAAQSQGFVNRIRYSRFEANTKGWTLYNPAALAATFAAGDYQGKRILVTEYTATAANQQVSFNADPFPVSAGERLSVVVGLELYGAGSGNRSIGLQYLNSAGGIVKEVTRNFAGTSVFNTKVGFIDPDPVPAGAVKAQLTCNSYSTGAGFVHFTITEPMAASVPVGQTDLPAFNPGPNAEDAADNTKTTWNSLTGKNPEDTQAQLNTATTTAQTASDIATQANNFTKDVADNGKFSSDEKKRYVALVNQWAVDVPNAVANANTLGLQFQGNALSTAWSAFYSYLQSVGYSNVGTTTAINRTQFINLSNAFSAAETNLANESRNYAKILAQHTTANIFLDPRFERITDTAAWTSVSNPAKIVIEMPADGARVHFQPDSAAELNIFAVPVVMAPEDRMDIEFQYYVEPSVNSGTQFGIYLDGRTGTGASYGANAVITRTDQVTKGQWLTFRGSVPGSVYGSSLTAVLPHIFLGAGLSGGSVYIRNPKGYRVPGALSNVSANGRATTATFGSTNAVAGIRSLNLTGFVLSQTNAGSSITVNASAGQYRLDTGAILNYPSASFTGLSYNTTYYFWRNDGDLNGGTGYGYSTNPADAANAGLVYLGYITTMTSGGTGGSGGGGGQQGCVDPDMYVEVEHLGPTLARYVEPGQRILCLTEDLTGTEYVEVEGNRIQTNIKCTIIAETGEELMLAVNTPMPNQAGEYRFAANAWTGKVPVGIGHNGGPALNGPEWEACSVKGAGVGEVSRISCHERIYAAGREPGRYIFSHNITYKP